MGQRVVPIFGYGYCKKGEGSWQEYVAVSSEHVVPLPDEISDGVGAQLVINPTTVWGILKELAVPQGPFFFAPLLSPRHASSHPSLTSACTAHMQGR